jgi:hypothetical protein
MAKEKTFVTVTNKEIYAEIQTLKECNTKQHEAIICRLDKTNGKVKLAFWIATTSLTLALSLVFWFFQHISK